MGFFISWVLVLAVSRRSPGSRTSQTSVSPAERTRSGGNRSMRTYCVFPSLCSGSCYLEEMTDLLPEGMSTRQIKYGKLHLQKIKESPEKCLSLEQ